MNHVYNSTFFDYIDHSARTSARGLINLLHPALKPQSLLDLGCGRGVWLHEWQRAGVGTILGVDGDYVRRDQLEVPQDAFLPADLTQPVPLTRRFDLAQSLEVGEHLPDTAAVTLVDSLTRASDIVLFSAAVKGQGGEHHINEQPLSYWQDLFRARGYTAYDCIRPHLSHDRSIAPWYRYNAVLYVNAAGRATLPDSILRHRLPDGQALANGGDLAWRLRLALVAGMPRGMVTGIARARALALATLARARKSGRAARA